jgi:hypothetical protein
MITSDEDVDLPNLRIVGSQLYVYDSDGGADGIAAVTLPVLETISNSYTYGTTYSAPNLTAIHSNAAVDGNAPNVDYLHNITRLNYFAHSSGDIVDDSGLESLSYASDVYVYSGAVPNFPSLTDVDFLQMYYTTNTNAASFAAVENLGDTYIYGSQLTNLTALMDVTLQPDTYLEVVYNSSLCQSTVDAWFSAVGATSYYSESNSHC